MRETSSQMKFFKGKEEIISIENDASIWIPSPSNGLGWNSGQLMKAEGISKLVEQMDPFITFFSPSPFPIFPSLFLPSFISFFLFTLSFFFSIFLNMNLSRHGWQRVRGRDQALGTSRWKRGGREKLFVTRIIFQTQPPLKYINLMGSEREGKEGVRNKRARNKERTDFRRERGEKWGGKGMEWKEERDAIYVRQL